MDTYLILVILLFGLAISDLIVGVSNDAVNFLNSSIGSRAAPRYIIMIVASLGILVGAIFSSGMMEVARKGIFHPGEFYFDEIMIIFLAVMIADVILLDLFNTFGFPTSTTVSIVFELLGAAVALSIIKMSNGAEGDINTFINTSTALGIISGILLSIVVAFTVGALIQFVTRLIFSFNYEKTIDYWGALWGGASITAITYFILVKGAKGSSMITSENLEMIKSNTITILLISFVFWAVVFQLVIWFTKINMLKVIVLVGTFALAMAFAGNDLVNFIGVPLAGLSSYSIFNEASNASADGFLMTALAGKVKTQTYLLILAGLIMTVTLWLSKKAKTVTETEINLSRQDAGYERFGSSAFSRSIVRGSYRLGLALRKITPKPVTKFVQDRYQAVKQKNEKLSESFDLLRASVNLTVASILISFATSLKLPLSTTYVTFMVAMGSSFADGAWGRETAVYRITGVTSVIGGWFLTALGAFSGAFLLALAIYWGGNIAIACAIVLAVLFVIKTHGLHKKRQKSSSGEAMVTGPLGHSDILQKSTKNVLATLESVDSAYDDIINCLLKEKLSKMVKTVKKVKKLNKEVKGLKDNVYTTINDLREDLIESGHNYVQTLDHLREMAHCLTYISKAVHDHLDNTHKGLLDGQQKEFRALQKDILKLIRIISELIKSQKFEKLEQATLEQQKVLKYIHDLNRKQLKRIKKGQITTKNALLCLTVLSESKNLLLHLINLTKAERDFYSQDTPEFQIG